MSVPPTIVCATPPVSTGNGVWRSGRWGRWAGFGVLLAGLIVQAEPPGNYYRGDNVLPGDVQRVLVLPLTAEAGRAELATGCESLAQVLQSELTRTRKFEVVTAPAEAVRLHTGRAAWSAAEALPAKFFSSLREAYGCDAVLFCELTAFKAYAPLAVGWRMRLVDGRSQQTLWASDELFQGAGAQAAGQSTVWKFPWQKRPDWLSVHSPRRFAEITLASVLASLPER